QRWDEEQRSEAAHLAAEHSKIAAQVPGWDDPATRAVIAREIVEFARGLGYSHRDLYAINDARAVVVAWNAMQRGKEVTQARAAETAGRHATQAKARAAEAQRGIERAAQSHTRRDAAAAIQLLMPD